MPYCHFYTKGGILFYPIFIEQLESLGTGAAAHALMLWSLKESIVKAKGETVWDGLTGGSLTIQDRHRGRDRRLDRHQEPRHDGWEHLLCRAVL